MLTKSDLRAIRDLVFELITQSTETLKKELKDQVITRLDEVMGEIKTIREEQTIMASRQSEHSDTLEDHEGRITKLEQTT